MTNLARIHQPTADELHEQRILDAYHEWLEYGGERPGLWARLVDLISQRSAAQVERMERDRGIR